jgi:transcriptional regulator with GAF, ATPase, and Fis domain
MNLKDRIEFTRWLLTIFGIGVVLHCLAVLGFVATSPDLGLRCLLVNSSGAGGAEGKRGLEIRQITSEAAEGLRTRVADLGDTPQPGDRLLEIANGPAHTFAHFAARLLDLRNAQPFGNKIRDDVSIREQGSLLSPVFAKGDDVYVEVRYLRDGEERRSWLPLRTVPWQDITLTLIWFLLEFGILAVGALAFWARPYDQQARVFFAMCLVSLGGFVGGYHWWMIAGSLWLTVPFMACAMLVPVVSFHFFLVYPEPKHFFARYPRASLSGIYGLPVISMVALIGLASHSIWISGQIRVDGYQEWILSLLNEGIFIYLGIAAAYFLATLIALAAGFFTTRNAVLQNQVKWILWAAMFAMLPVGYSLSLAYFEKEKFSLGAASLPMFVASFLFMLAYAIGIARHKLMLVDEILSRGMVYYILNLAVTVGFSLAIAVASLAAMYQHNQVARHAAVVVVLVVLAVLLLNWSRDHVQRLIDRKFFREKFQLDRALQRMNQVAEGMGDPHALAQRMLASCRELLGVDRAALYLRDASEGVFRLLAVDGIPRAPFSISSDTDLLGLTHEDGSIQRSESEAEPTQSQQMLHELDVELVHALEVDGQLAGALFLGTKTNGARYTAEDLALLTTLGQITSVALQSARVHQAAAQLNKDLQLKIEKITEQQQLISKLQSEITSRQQVAESAETSPATELRRDFIKGSSPAIAAVLETVRKVSGSQSSILIRGESGTGKELLAAALHENSPRRNGPLVSVHCGALSAGLLESELFGHVKGAFTGAHRDKPGRFELANGGTLFLDEIGDITHDTQVKLLRVLQQREFEPVGGTRTVQVDVRLITATHQNLEKLITEGRFREDLFYRLNVISITLPPLRERADDIIELALYFLNRAAERAAKRITHLEESVIESLKRYAWPGNIRELENAIERAVVMAEGPEIRLLDLPVAIVTAAGRNARVIESKPPRSDSTASNAVSVDEQAASSPTAGTGTTGEPGAEKLALIEALTRTKGNKAEAARLLGIPRSTLFSRLKKHGFE